MGGLEDNKRGRYIDYTRGTTQPVMGNYTSRLPWQRALQEDIDLWRVYQLLYYKEQCGGDAVKIKAIKKHNIPAVTQRRVVDDSIAVQVCVCVTYVCY